METELKRQYSECSTHLSDSDEAIQIVQELIGSLNMKYQYSRTARLIIGSLKELAVDFFHHSFGSQCWAFDIDCIEHRMIDGSDTVVAVVEWKATGRDIPECRKRVMKDIATLYGVDAYLINYDPKMSLFTIYMMNDDLTWSHLADYAQSEIANWHRGLGR